MKKLMFNWSVSVFLIAITAIEINAQQYDAAVPGDNFSLEGALELFKKSSSPEAFEKLLNSNDSKVNNLDLNDDGYIDYIRVIDRNEGNVHAFILQAIISERESQDVAVIELEKLGNGEAVLQITGDADVYGIETIIEPTDEVRINAGTTTSRRVVNVWTWPSVQYVYSSYYTSVWVSPWHWSYRPMWYRPWRPVTYVVYSPIWKPYRSYYTVCYTHRVTYAHQLYRPYRSTSVIVSNRYHSNIKHYRSTRHDYDDRGHYKYGDKGRRPEKDDRYGDHRSNDRQRDSRGTAYTNGRQSDSRSTYANSNSRSSNDRRNQESQRGDYSMKDQIGNRSSTKRNESTTMNRSSWGDHDRMPRNNDASSKWSDTGKNSRNTNAQTNRSTANRSSINEAYQSSSQGERKVSGNNGSRQGSGNSRSQNNSGKSKKGGN